MLQSSSQMARVQDFLATEGCNWKFIPPHGPHFGGFWEAAVKSMKYHLRRTLGAQIATYEELCTLLAEIEASLNSRPLCALSNDLHNTTYLSPGHFLIGEPLTQLPSLDYTNVKCNRLSIWQSYQQELQHFWQRWSSDYLHELQQRQRWQRTSPKSSIEKWGVWQSQFITHLVTFLFCHLVLTIFHLVTFSFSDFLSLPPISDYF
jgi:hypothetical protein